MCIIRNSGTKRIPINIRINTGSKKNSHIPDSSLHQYFNPTFTVVLNFSLKILPVHNLTPYFLLQYNMIWRSIKALNLQLESIFIWLKPKDPYFICTHLIILIVRMQLNLYLSSIISFPSKIQLTNSFATNYVQIHIAVPGQG